MQNTAGAIIYGKILDFQHSVFILLDDRWEARHHKDDFIRFARQTLVCPAQPIAVDTPHLIWRDETKPQLIGNDDPILLLRAEFCDQFIHFLLNFHCKWLFIYKVVLYELHKKIRDKQSDAIQDHYI